MQTPPVDIAIPTRCQQCQADLKFPVVCTSCRQLHPPLVELDLFRLMGIPRTYRINLDDLKSRFLEISRFIHPDRFSGADPHMQLQATRLSAMINEAIATLSDPVARAEYLLQLCGGSDALADRTVPQDVLAQVLMIREEIEDARSSHDRDALQRIQNQVSTMESAGLAGVAALAEKLPSGDERDRTQLRRELNSVKYFQKLRAELEGTER